VLRSGEAGVCAAAAGYARDLSSDQGDAMLDAAIAADVYVRWRTDNALCSWLKPHLSDFSC
jgi:hypothetical protein